jgi:hypothetical protein
VTAGEARAWSTEPDDAKNIVLADALDERLLPCALDPPKKLGH